MSYFTEEPKDVYYGTAQLMISGRDSTRRPPEDSPCSCCPEMGGHVFAASVAVDDVKHLEGGGILHTFVHRRKYWIEGKRVRITVEVLDE